MGISDKQTSEFSSYLMFNVFDNYDQREHFDPLFSFWTDKPEVREDLKLF